jgi:hypothetical protein
MTAEDGPAHRPPWEEGLLDQEIASRMADLQGASAHIRSFRDLALRFGQVAHFVADASFPPGASGASGAARYRDFGGFCESRLDRIPLVFYGHDDPALATGDARAFALAVLDTARVQDLDLARAYAQAGEHPDPAAFDDRSVPFAVASLSYSRSVTSIVRAWLAAWGWADGDLRQTPYLKSVRTYRREASSNRESSDPSAAPWSACFDSGRACPSRLCRELARSGRHHPLERRAPRACAMRPDPGRRGLGYTDPRSFGGRVKTLHPRIHAGIQSGAQRSEHRAELARGRGSIRSTFASSSASILCADRRAGRARPAEVTR